MKNLTITEFKNLYAPGTDEYDWTKISYKKAKELAESNDNDELQFPVSYDIFLHDYHGKGLWFGSADSHLELPCFTAIQVWDDRVILSVMPQISEDEDIRCVDL